MSEDTGLPIFEHLNKNAYVISTSVFCVIATLANLFMMMTIMGSPRLRRSGKHVLVLILCLSDFNMGVFEFPLMAQYFALEKWTHDPNLLKALDFSVYFVMLSFRMSLLVGLCWSSVLRMLTKDRVVSMVMSVSMVILAVGYSIVLVIPTTEHPDKLHPGNVCSFVQQQTKQTTISVVAFYPQAVMMVILMIDIVIISRCTSQNVSGSTPKGAETKIQNVKNFPADVIAACLLMLVCITPFRVVCDFRIFSDCSDSNCWHAELLWRGVTGRWQLVRPCLMPFVWLLCVETRRGVRQVWCCRKKQDPALQTNDTTAAVENVNHKDYWRRM